MKHRTPSSRRSINQHTLNLRLLQNRTRRLAVIIFTLLVTAAFYEISEAQSSIDPVSQTYFVQEFDQAGPLRLRRLYSSGSTFRGHFGQGWCSELDARIQIFAGQEIRYRGCDITSAAAVDPRRSVQGIVRGNFGFRRLREDGATQVFNRDGHLQRIVRSDGTIEIFRDERDRPEALAVRTTNPSKLEQRIPLTRVDATASEDVDLSLIASVGAGPVFQYQAALLIRTESSRFAYDDDLNMIVRNSGAVSETIDYDSREDRVIRIVRSAAFGRERLLLAIARTGKSVESGIEMKVEVERGAEMRPVRILYNRLTRRLSLEGDRDVARMILNWLRA